MTAVEALWLINRLLAVYPDANEQTAIEYRRLLERLSYDIASEAIDRIIARSPSWPRFAMIRAEYRQALADRPAPIADSAETDEERAARSAELRAWADQHLGSDAPMISEAS